MNQHTPGEWSVVLSKPGAVEPVPSDREVAMVYNVAEHAIAHIVSAHPKAGYARSSAEWRAENAANARLLAAAQSLLAACEGVLREFDEWEGPPEPETCDAARARNRAVATYEAVKAAIAEATGRECPDGGGVACCRIPRKRQVQS